MFKAILLNKDDTGSTRAACVDVEDAQLPQDADVTVQISYSTLNYKDGLAITGRAPVVRSWPMIPGIDGAGEILESTHPDWKPGDGFILNGWGVGETHKGCLAQKARLKGEWLIPLPEGMTARTAMAIGTAGYTAMLCVMALEEHGVTPEQGEVLVTGAAGGVGSIAILLLAQQGYTVVASTGRLSESSYLKDLGATDIIDRADLSSPGKPLQRERWAGVVDCVGSHTLVNAIAQTRYGGAVAACGLAQGMDLPASVAPFILRGVTLAGVDSVMAPRSKRLTAWKRLAKEVPASKLSALTREISLADAIPEASTILAGQVRGRLVVDVNR